LCCVTYCLFTTFLSLLKRNANLDNYIQFKMDSRSDSRAATLAEKELERNTPSSQSIDDSLWKETQEGDDPEKDEAGSVENAGAAGGEEDDGEYPNGMRMAFIVVALVLSIFLVSDPTPPPPRSC